MKNQLLIGVLSFFFQAFAMTSVGQQIAFRPLHIFPNSTGRTELAGKPGERFMTIQYSDISDTVKIVWFDPKTTTIENKSIVQAEINRASHVGYFITGDTCFFVVQSIRGSLIQIGVVGVDGLGNVFQPYKILDEFTTNEKKPTPFSFQYFKNENAVLLSKWKLIPGTRKLADLRIINSKGVLVSKQAIQTGYPDERVNLDLFLYRGKAYAAMQLMNAEYSPVASTIIYKSSTGSAAFDPIIINQPDFYIENLLFSTNARSGDLYLGGLFFPKKQNVNGGLALLKVNGLKPADQFERRLFEKSLFKSLYPSKKEKNRILEEELVLEKFEFTDSGKVTAYVHKMIVRNEDLSKNKEYYADYRIANSVSPAGNLTPSQNFDRMRYDFNNTPYGNLSASPNSPILRLGGGTGAAVQSIDFSGGYSSPTVIQSNGLVTQLETNVSGVLTNDLLTIEEAIGGIKVKELSRSKLSMRSMPMSMINSLNDSEFVSIQYPEGREYIIFQGRLSDGSNFSTKSLFPERYYPFYGLGTLVYAGYRKLATLYLDKETGEVGLALLGW